MKIIASVASLLAVLSSCNAETSLLRASISTDEPLTIIDLSQDIPRDEAAISCSPGAKAVQEAAAEDPQILNFMVIENGSIVSSYHRDDVDPNEPHHTQSATKTWMNLLIGKLVKDGLLSLDETLGEIFTSDDAWADVADGSIDFVKGVTIEELLTMTSGLIDDTEKGLGGESLEGSLSYPLIGVKGEWSYLMASQIPSYIIIERTGLTPRQYQAEHVMGKLGIGEDEYKWYQNADGVERWGQSLYLTPMQMAKFGQLYLQGGRTSPSNDERLISKEWIDASFTNHSTSDFSSFGFPSDYPFSGLPYGYWFFGMYEYPSRPTVYCAGGNNGQTICVDRGLGRVVIQQREGPWDEPADRWNKVVDFVFENTLSFCAPNSLTGMSSTVESRAE